MKDRQKDTETKMWRKRKMSRKKGREKKTNRESFTEILVEKG